MTPIRTRRAKEQSLFSAVCSKTILAVLVSLFYLPACAAQTNRPPPAPQSQETNTTPPTSQSEEDTEWYMPEEGVLPDSATAARAAQVILERVYGADVIARQLPLAAVLRDGVWRVSGTIPQTFTGGTAVILMNRQDGRVLGMIHER